MTKQEQTYEDAVLKTVMWWSEKAFSTPMNQNNGDNSSAGGMAFLLMNMLASKAQMEATPDKIKKFEEKLTELLMQERRQRTHISLHVDYHPDEILFNACAFAGVDPSVLPCKTSSWISPENIVSTRYQYGGSVQVI